MDAVGLIADGVEPLAVRTDDEPQIRIRSIEYGEQVVQEVLAETAFGAPVAHVHVRVNPRHLWHIVYPVCARGDSAGNDIRDQPWRPLS